MKTELRAIASVQMGNSFRTRLEPHPQGNVTVIQMKDLTRDNLLAKQGLLRIEMNNMKAKHRVNRKDLVFRSRGKINTATIIEADFDTCVIAAPLLRIRVKTNSVLSDYLCWFINQPASQAILQSKATGTAMRMIGKSILEKLKIPLPAILVQQKIIELNNLATKERQLIKQLAEKKKKLVAGILMRLALNHQ